MISAWTKHLKTPEERIKFAEYVKGSRSLLERLRDLLTEEENNLDHLDLSVKAFESSNWAYAQAYRNGFRCCLKMVQKLINLDQKDN